ncbi:hypothetical protein [Salinicola salarius]|uniref:hypothetical protein n=1 Tax=Salinicola salarius TaxID=430457 RepID=UPI000DA231BA|nr:hypothetical protein [Salinicola salarius]
MIKRVLRAWREGNGIEPPPDVVFHIGAPKSGSSAIQRFCLGHTAELRKLGFYYPEHSLDKNGVSGGHTQVAGRLINGDFEAAREKFQEWLDEARQEGLTLLLSAEAFYGKHAELRQMTQGLNVRVLAFLRNPLDYLIGNHNQGIKRHMSTRRLSQEVEWALETPTGHLAGVPLLAWADAFGDSVCDFRAYISPREDGPPIERAFLEALGASAEQARAWVPKTEITNRSYVASALELKRLLNTALVNLPDRMAHEVDWSLQGFSDRAHDLRSYHSQDLPEEVMNRLVGHFQGQMQPVVERFPELATALGTIDSGSNNAPLGSLDLATPLASLAEDAPETLDAIRHQAVCLRDQGANSYAFFRLLEVLNIDFAEPAFPQQALSPQARQVLGNEKSKDADYLREFGLTLERLGYFEEALLIMGTAQERRPQGQGIRKILDRLRERLGKANDEVAK